MADSTVYSTAINPGAPPLRWDNVYEAFQQVNANFEMIEAALGSAGITPINFNDLDSSVSPADTATFTLGSIAKQWKSVHTAEWIDVAGSEFNGLWAGNAHIKGIGYTIDLPLNSTVDGNLIIDPAKVWFNEIQIDNNESIVATDVNDSFNILSGNGISLSVDSGAESLTVSNTGILDVTAGAGISRTIVSGTANIVNTGVLTLANTGGIGTRTSGLGINVSSAAGNPVITNTGVISISSGVGITVSLDAVTGDVTVSNSAPAVNAFAQIEVDGDSANRLQADAVSDVLNIVSGAGITLSKNTSTDTLTITVNPVFDLKGSVFGDDSSILVDAVSNYIYGNVRATTLRTSEQKIALGDLAGETTQGANAVAIGREAGRTTQGGQAVAIGGLTGQTSQGDSAVAIGVLAGQTSQGMSTVAIGNQAGQTTQGNVAIAIGAQAGETSQGSIAVAIGQNAGQDNQGSSGIAIGYYAGKDTQGTGAISLGYTAAQVTQGSAAVAIGWSAGQTNQGANAIAIGYRAGFTNQNASSIVINASGVALNTTGAGLYVDPIRLGGSGRSVMYDIVTKEIFYSNIELLGNSISTSDSSGLTVDVQTTFNTDVTFENDITVAERLTVKGSRVINITELQAISAASTSFSDFQARIAALA